jgi:hypothetical protein
VKIDVVNASCAFSRPKGRPVILHNLKAVIPKNQLTGLYSMLLFGLTDDQCIFLLKQRDGKIRQRIPEGFQKGEKELVRNSSIRR